MNISTILEEEEKDLSNITHLRPMEFLLTRPRRNRKSRVIRDLVRETVLLKSDLIYPLFICENGMKREIESMPGIYRHSLEDLFFEIERALRLGVAAFALFPVISSHLKSPRGEEAYNPKGLLPSTLYEIKKRFPESCLISDVALDAYTDHGHDGIVDEKGDIANDATIEKLVEMALVQARVGVDMIAPSDMMDGRVGVLRRALDREGYSHVSIHAYSAKYASSLYAPYREACDSTPHFGDKRSYQMDPANQKEASLEASLDEEEGADILMVKPAIFYLDIIARLQRERMLPISAFQVSGEYAMLQAAANQGWLSFDKALLESLISIKRAGAKMIFTYGALKAAELLNQGRSNL